MSEKLERTIGEVESDLSREPAEAPPETKKVKKVAKAKKVAKKVAKKSKESKKVESGEVKITLADLASEAEITTAAARRKLRSADLSREGRWSWDEGSKGLAAARKALGLDE